jgi:hypothetical protein
VADHIQRFRTFSVCWFSRRNQRRLPSLT